MMEAKDIAMGSQVRDHFSKKPSRYTYEEISNLMMESRKAGIGEEQKRITKALRELHKKGWTLADVIEAEDTFGED